MLWKNPLVSIGVLAMASKQLSRKKMVGGGGLYLEPYPRGRGKF